VVALWVVGFGSFVLASLLVGVRLVAVARRTRGIPEAAMGTALLLGGLGYASIVVALRAVVRESAPLPLALGNLALHVGAIALAFATWRIFRAGERWPAAIVAGIAAVLAASFALRLVHVRVVPAPLPVFWMSSLGDAAAYAWSTAESLRYWSMMRRRLVLGLAAPATTRRFGLWALGAGCAVAMHGVSIAGRLLAGDAMPAPAVLASSALGLVAAYAIARAFFPGRRARARAAAAA
jgi:hypothetical protein